MYQVIIVFHVLVGLGIIGLVLMQQGKGADAGAAFGSGASGTIFGARGSASFLSRATAIFAALFFSTSLGLAVLGGKQVQQKDIMETPANQSEVPVIGGVPVPSPPASNTQTGPQPQNPAEVPQVTAPAAGQPAAPATNAEVPVAPEVKPEAQINPAPEPKAKK